MNKITPLLLIILIGSLWQFPSTTPILSMIFMVFSLAMAISAIFKRHSTSDNPRTKIAKDILILMATLLLIIFLGGLAGLIVNFYVSLLFGKVTGFLVAISVSLLMGYLVKKGIGKFIG